MPQATNIEVVFDTYPDLNIPAEIKEIGTEASATTRTYPITLIMDQPEDVQVLPGMAGKASGEPPRQAALPTRGVRSQLRPAKPDKLAGLLAPCPDGWLVSQLVGPRVNSPQNDDADCLLPPAEYQPSLF